MSALRLTTLTLSAPDPRESERFYRWCLDLKPDETAGGDRRELSWGREDRLVLAPHGGRDGEESVGLRMAARRMEQVVAWCRESGIDPVTLRVPPEDEGAARAAWPGRPLEIDEGEAANRIEIRIRAPGGLHVELWFPLPAEIVAKRGLKGPFSIRSGDWSGLEIPGLLGVRTGVPDPRAFGAFAGMLGARPMSEGEDEPLAVGDHQWIVEARERPAIQGLAFVVSAARLGAVQRTLAHMEVAHRLDGQRLLTLDPGGRTVLIHGVRQG